MIDFNQYYKYHFQNDLLAFLAQIPDKSKFHYSTSEITIQYFTLTPCYKYLDIIASENRGMFAVSLFWSFLVDQVCYTYFREEYNYFQSLTRYPKFIGNCTGTGFFTSKCGHHQHPQKILIAINDKNDSGNRIDADKEPYKRDESLKIRKPVIYEDILKNSVLFMKVEVESYFKEHQQSVNWKVFWNYCLAELPEDLAPNFN